MSMSIPSLRQAVDRDLFVFAARINIYGLGLFALWSAVNTTILAERVSATTPDSLTGSALGLITFLGVGLATVVQPIAGRASDGWTRSDPRRPFIIAGTLLLLPGMVLFGVASGFVVLVIGFVTMQLATNISQAAFQAFIPDLIDEDERGTASGIKNVLSVVGAAVGLMGMQVIRSAGLPRGWILVWLGLIMLVVGSLSLKWVPRISPVIEGPWPETMVRAADPRRVWRESVDTLRQHRRFRFAVIAQFVFMLGAYPAQRFLLLFLRERFGGNAERMATVGVAVGILIAVIAAVIAGMLSDRIGRIPVLEGSVVLGGIGILVIGFTTTLGTVALAGSLVAIGYGAFLAVNWAMLTDDLPEDQSAAALGVANIATAGAGALAGVFGPVVDVMNAFLPQGTYQALFGIAGAVALSSLIALRQVPRTRAST